MDDGSPIGYCIAIALLVLGSAFSAAMEMAFASVNRIRMMSNASNGDRRAKRVLYILDHFDKALTTLLIGNNILHISCASTATLMATKLWGVGSVTTMTFCITIVLFLLAEMLPKRYAKAMSEPFAMAFSGVLLFLMRVLFPVSFLFSKLSALVSRPFRKAGAAPTVTEDELYEIMDTVASEGAIDEEKTELVQSALEFSDVQAGQVMTPWKDVLVVGTFMTDNEILDVIQQNNHSRLPVIDRRENVVGLLHIRKYLKATLRHEGRVRLRNVMDPPLFIGPNMQIDDLLSLMSAKRTQISVVRDEAEKRVLGIISVEDILEELVGEIYDEDDHADGEVDA